MLVTASSGDPREMCLCCLGVADLGRFDCGAGRVDGARAWARSLGAGPSRCGALTASGRIVNRTCDLLQARELFQLATRLQFPAPARQQEAASFLALRVATKPTTSQLQSLVQ